MPTYLSPGVYVEEKPAGSAPIEGVGTAVAAFVGIAMTGPINQPTLISNWKQFVDTFGDFTPDGYLAHAVYGYFLNGGGNCFVVRIGADGGPKPALAETTINAAPETDGKQQERFTVRALEAGDAGSGISVEVADATDGGEDTFKLVVRRGGRIEEQHDNLSGSAQGPPERGHHGEGGQPAHRARRGAQRPRRAPRQQHRHARLGGRHAGPARAVRLRRQRRRPHRLRRARDDRRDHHDLRPRRDGRLSEGRHRPGGRQGGPVGDDRPLRTDG